MTCWRTRAPPRGRPRIAPDDVEQLLSEAVGHPVQLSDNASSVAVRARAPPAVRGRSNGAVPTISSGPRRRFTRSSGTRRNGWLTLSCAERATPDGSSPMILSRSPGPVPTGASVDTSASASRQKQQRWRTGPAPDLQGSPPLTRWDGQRSEHSKAASRHQAHSAPVRRLLLFVRSTPFRPPTLISWAL